MPRTSGVYNKVIRVDEALYDSLRALWVRDHKVDDWPKSDIGLIRYAVEIAMGDD